MKLGTTEHLLHELYHKKRSINMLYEYEDLKKKIEEFNYYIDLDLKELTDNKRYDLKEKISSIEDTYFNIDSGMENLKENLIKLHETISILEDHFSKNVETLNPVIGECLDYLNEACDDINRDIE